jgi:hypothetical protein
VLSTVNEPSERPSIKIDVLGNDVEGEGGEWVLDKAGAVIRKFLCHVFCGLWLSLSYLTSVCIEGIAE